VKQNVGRGANWAERVEAVDSTFSTRLSQTERQRFRREYRRSFESSHHKRSHSSPVKIRKDGINRGHWIVGLGCHRQ
jgi:hypothetical protein